MKATLLQRRDIAALLSAAAAVLLIYLAIKLLATDGAGFRGRRFFGIWEFAVLVDLAMATLLIANVYRLSAKGQPIVILPDALNHPSWRHSIPFAEIDRVILQREQPAGGRRAMQVSLLLKSGLVQPLPAGLLPTAPTTFANRLRTAIKKHGSPPLS